MKVSFLDLKQQVLIHAADRGIIVFTVLLPLYIFSLIYIEYIGYVKVFHIIILSALFLIALILYIYLFSEKYVEFLRNSISGDLIILNHIIIKHVKYADRVFKDKKTPVICIDPNTSYSYMLNTRYDHMAEVSDEDYFVFVQSQKNRDELMQVRLQWAPLFNKYQAMEVQNLINNSINHYLSPGAKAVKLNEEEE